MRRSTSPKVYTAPVRNFQWRFSEKPGAAFATEQFVRLGALLNDSAVEETAKQLSNSY